jgi:hypothetical protein
LYTGFILPKSDMCKACNILSIFKQPKDGVIMKHHKLEAEQTTHVLGEKVVQESLKRTLQKKD